MNIAIVLAGGTGTRIGGPIPKQFIKVQGKPIMVYALEVCEHNTMIDGIVLVCVDSYVYLARQYCEQYGITKVKWIVPGGKDFTHSCINGMDCLKDICSDEDNVLIVAADRPFISEKEVYDAIQSSNEHGSGIPVRKCALCMFMVDEDRSHSHNYQRENLVQIQSPWTFQFGPFWSALKKYLAGLLPPCENYPVAIYVAAGNEVYFTEGDPQNIKITEKTDILLMEQILKAGACV